MVRWDNDKFLAWSLGFMLILVLCDVGSCFHNLGSGCESVVQVQLVSQWSLAGW